MRTRAPSSAKRLSCSKPDEPANAPAPSAPRSPGYHQRSLWTSDGKPAVRASTPEPIDSSVKASARPRNEAISSVSPAASRRWRASPSIVGTVRAATLLGAADGLRAATGALPPPDERRDREALADVLADRPAPPGSRGHRSRTGAGLRRGYRRRPRLVVRLRCEAVGGLDPASRGRAREGSLPSRRRRRRRKLRPAIRMSPDGRSGVAGRSSASALATTGGRPGGGLPPSRHYQTSEASTIGLGLMGSLSVSIGDAFVRITCEASPTAPSMPSESDPSTPRDGLPRAAPGRAAHESGEQPPVGVTAESDPDTNSLLAPSGCLELPQAGLGVVGGDPLVMSTIPEEGPVPRVARSPGQRG